MASPVVASNTSGLGGGTGSTAGTDHPLAFGGSVLQAGDLAIVLFRFTAAPGTVTSKIGGSLTQLVSDASDASDDTTQIWYRWCDGAETGNHTSLTSTNAVKSAAIGFRVTGAENPATRTPEISTVAVGTTTANTANPASRAVTGGPKDVLYFALMGIDGSAKSPTVAPTNYTGLLAQAVGGGGAATQGATGGAHRQISASSSDDPGVFTHPAANSAWTAWTVVVHPAGPAGTAHTATPADTLSLADTFDRLRTSVRTPADTVAFADSVKRQKVSPSVFSRSLDLRL